MVPFVALLMLAGSVQGLHLDLSLNHHIRTGSRRVCGVVQCLEEFQTRTLSDHITATSHTDQNRPSLKTITGLTIFKSSGPPSSHGAAVSDALGTVVAALTPRQPRLSRVADGVKVTGHLEARRASLALELVKPNDCLADFACQLRTVDADGVESLISTRVQQQQQQQGQIRRTQGDWTLFTHPAASLRILDLLHELDAKVTATSKSTEKLEGRVEDFQTNVDSKLYKISDHLDNKLDVLKDRLEDKIGSSAKDLRDDFATFQNRLEDKLEDGVEDKVSQLIEKVIVFTSSTDSYSDNVKKSFNERLTALSQELKREQQETLTNLSSASRALVENKNNATEALVSNTQSLAQKQTQFQNEMLEHFSEAIHEQSRSRMNISNALTDQFTVLRQDLRASFHHLESNITHSTTETLLSAQNFVLQSNSTALAAMTDLLSPKSCYRGLIPVLSKPSYPYPLIIPSEGSLLDVPYLCDTATGGGGWVIIQRRTTGTVDFYRGWQDYRNGFGDLRGDFWLGNEHVHQMTSSGSYELRVELIYDGRSTAVRYGTFSLAAEGDGYALTVGNFRGETRDSLTRHSGKRFTTFDRDNDNHGKGNCAVLRSGAWWYDACADSNLNGKWGTGDYKGPQWAGFSGGNPVSYSEMKIRLVAVP